MRIAILDNLDSFTYNLYHKIEPFVDSIDVIRNDDYKALDKLSNYDAWVLSPGPGLPKDSGCLMKALKLGFGKIPILGVCLGMQAIAIHQGGKLFHLAHPQHGKEHVIKHIESDSKLFRSINPPFQVGLYHSWAVDERSIKASGLVHSESNILMAAEWIDKKAFGLQFHPESIMTPGGGRILENWINLM
jgi:anthranilate synthase component 2